MTRYLFCLIFLATLIYGCSDKISIVNRPPAFTSFEVSYTDGQAKSFSFIVDTNKIYLSPHNIDTTYYGILPDTIFAFIDRFVVKLLNDTSIQSTGDKCYDCSVVAIQVVTKSDTIRISQANKIDQPIRNIINSLQTFIYEGRHQKINSIIFL